MSPSLKLAIELAIDLIKQHIGQQRRERTAWWRSFVAVDHQAVIQQLTSHRPSGLLY
jgi:hypothetical protein